MQSPNELHAQATRLEQLLTDRFKADIGQEGARELLALIHGKQDWRELTRTAKIPPPAAPAETSPPARQGGHLWLQSLWKRGVRRVQLTLGSPGCAHRADFADAHLAPMELHLSETLVTHYFDELVKLLRVQGQDGVDEKDFELVHAKVELGEKPMLTVRLGARSDSRLSLGHPVEDSAVIPCPALECPALVSPK